MSNWQERVLDERSQLSEKLDKLEDFLKSFARDEGDESGISYLDLQKYAMRLYLYTLDRRIDLFEDSEHE